MIRAHVIALDPTVKQVIHFARACGVARFAQEDELEIWMAVPVAEFSDLYEISSHGRLRKLAYVDTNGRRHASQIIVPGIDWSGYPSVALRKNGRSTRKRIHVLVAGAFLGPKPDGMEICHNDSDPMNSRSDNLRYDTRTGNFSDKKLAGTDNAGSKHPLSRLSEDTVRLIRQKRGAGAMLSDLSAEFGLAKSTICQITKGDRWKHV